MANGEQYLKAFMLDTYQRVMNYLKAINVPAKWRKHVDWNDLRGFAYLGKDKLSRIPKDLKKLKTDVLKGIKKGTDGQGVLVLKDVPIYMNPKKRFGYVNVKDIPKADPENYTWLNVSLEARKNKANVDPEEQSLVNVVSEEEVRGWKVIYHVTGGMGYSSFEGSINVAAYNVKEAEDKAIPRIAKEQNVLRRDIHIDSVNPIGNKAMKNECCKEKANEVKKKKSGKGKGGLKCWVMGTPMTKQEAEEVDHALDMLSDEHGDEFQEEVMDEINKMAEKQNNPRKPPFTHKSQVLGYEALNICRNAYKQALEKVQSSE